VGLEELEERFQAWTPTPCGYLEVGSAVGQNGVKGRWTSGMCEGHEGVQALEEQDGGADRQNCSKVR
jgi:hypothetical protein